jgi:transposase-like protein
VRPSSATIAQTIKEAGSIRKAAPILGVDERTVRRWLKDAHYLTTEGITGLRTLAVDIETRPNLAYVWDLWNQNVNLEALVEPTGILCWAAKWLGQPEIEFRSIHHTGHETMIRRAWTLLNEADAVVHYNGQRFDIPHLNREFVLIGLNPPSPYKQIDLLKTAKKQFRFPSNKLAHVSEALGLVGKVKHEGYRLWFKCMAGDDEAWETMREYNVRDVALLEDLYDRLKPWIVNHPSVAAMYAVDVCPTCGSDELVEDGFVTLKTARYVRFRCASCGSWCRSTKREAGTTVTEVA